MLYVVSMLLGSLKFPDALGMAHKCTKSAPGEQEGGEIQENSILSEECICKKGLSKILYFIRPHYWIELKFIFVNLLVCFCKILFVLLLSNKSSEEV